MKIKAFHPNLDSIKSYLTAKAQSGQAVLNVLNAANFSVDDFVVIGEVGKENAEIGRVDSISGNAITLTANLSTTHGQNVSVNKIAYDQVELWKASSETGVYAAVAGTKVDLAIDDENTTLEDTSAGANDYYKIKFYNSVSASYSGFSSAVGSGGFQRYALASIHEHTLDLAEDQSQKKINKNMITEWVNEWKDIVANELSETDEKYFLVKREYSLSAGENEIDFTGDMRKIQKVEVNLDGGSYYRTTWEDIEDDLPDLQYSSTDPRHYFNGEKLGFRPSATVDCTPRVWQIEQPEDLTEDGDTLPSPLRYYLNNLYDFLEHKIFKQKRKQAFADSSWNKFRGGLETIIEHTNSRMLENREVKDTDYGDGFDLIA